MGIPSVIAGVLAVHGSGLISAARDYAVFVIVLAFAALAGLVTNSRPAKASGKVTLAG